LEQELFKYKAKAEELAQSKKLLISELDTANDKIGRELKLCNELNEKIKNLEATQELYKADYRKLEEKYGKMRLSNEKEMKKLKANINKFKKGLKEVLSKAKHKDENVFLHINIDSQHYRDHCKKPPKQ